MKSYRVFAALLALLLCVFVTGGCKKTDTGDSSSRKASSAGNASDGNESVESAESGSLESEGGQSAQSAQSRASSRAAQSGAGGNKAFEKYNPEISISTVNLNPTGVIYKSGDSAEKNPWTRLYKSEIGVNLNFKWIANDDSQWQEKTNLMITANDLPDFFMADVNQFNMLLASGVLADMTAVYDQYASPELKSLLSESGQAVMDSASKNKKLMALPFPSSPKEQMPMMMIRKDWLEKLNLPVPKTMEELYNVAAAFTNNDPDGNKVKDTVGIALDNWVMHSSYYTGLAAGFGAHPGKWIKKGDSLVFGTIQPEMKEALAFANRMYKDGLVDKGFAGKNMYDVQKTVINGKCGLLFYPMYAPIGFLQKNYEANQNAEWGYYALPSTAGKPAKFMVDTGAQFYWVVSNKCKNPEAVVKMANLWVKHFYNTGEDAKTTELSDNTMWMNALPKMYKGFANVETAIKTIDVLSGKTAYKSAQKGTRTTYDRIQAFKKGDISLWYVGQTYGIGGTLSVVDKYRKENLFLDNAFYGAPTRTMTTNAAALSETVSVNMAKFVNGTRNMSEFEQFVKEWQNIGGTAVTKEVNEWYKNK